MAPKATGKQTSTVKPKQPSPPPSMSESEGDPSSEDEYIAEEVKSKSRIGKVCRDMLLFCVANCEGHYSVQHVASPFHPNPTLRYPMALVKAAARSLLFQTLAALSARVTMHPTRLRRRGKSPLNPVRPMILLGNTVWASWKSFSEIYFSDILIYILRTTMGATTKLMKV